MGKMNDSTIDNIDDTKNLINEELDYLYHKEKYLLENITDVMNLRQDLLNGIKEDLKKLSDLYSNKEDCESQQLTEDKQHEEAMFMEADDNAEALRTYNED